MFDQSVFSFFTDPILRAPTIGCMLMCLATSLVGALVLLRKQALIGETLSHAAYPGLICGVMLAGCCSIGEDQEFLLSFAALGGAFLTAFLGMSVVAFLEKRMHVHPDAALCFVLSTFFGIGITLASHVQFQFTSLYKQVSSYLYGQAATMTDIHIVIYGCLAFIVILIISLFYKELQLICFDHPYAASLGIPVKRLDTLLFILITLSIIIGIRSVGVVLMSGMLIAPATAARQFTHRLSLLLILAAFFGMVSGFLGNYFSIQMSAKLQLAYPSSRLSFPTGPMIIMTATTICLYALLLAPEKGLLMRLLRMLRFRYKCLCENILKSMGRQVGDQSYSFTQLQDNQGISTLYLRYLLWTMQRKGWLSFHSPSIYRLTSQGQQQAEKIIRLHRLWEVYLANYMGMEVNRVHCQAEEMEHILTPELEKELTSLLHNPQRDPHSQPIPLTRDFYVE